MLLLAALTSVSAQKPYSVTWKNFNTYSTRLPEGSANLPPSLRMSTGDSRWSIGCETLDRDYADFSQFRKYVGPLGVGYARIQSG